MRFEWMQSEGTQTVQNFDILIISRAYGAVNPDPLQDDRPSVPESPETNFWIGIKP